MKNVRYIKDYFLDIVCGDMIENSKPAPDIYLKACELISVEPKKCYALEDSKNGLLSAYRAGCKTIIFAKIAYCLKQSKREAQE